MSDTAAPRAPESMAMVVVRSPGRVPLHLLIGEPLIVGRECDGLLLDDPLLSRRHVEVRFEAGALVVTDLGSTNGTTVDDRAVSSAERVEEGAVVAFGGSTLEVLAPCRMEGERAASDLGRSTIDDLADAFASERPHVSAVAQDRGTTTIVFSDIEASTARAEELGDQRWYELLGVHNTIVRRNVTVHGGKEIKTQGDGFMLSFPSARGAVQCMLSVQRELTARSLRSPYGALRIRVGVHTGEPIVDGDGDLFGKHVIFAARIADEARGGEVVVSSLVRQLIEAHGDIRFGEPREVQLKGLTGTHTIFPIHRDDATSRSPGSVAPVDPTSAAAGDTPG